MALQIKTMNKQPENIMDEKTPTDCNVHLSDWLASTAKIKRAWAMPSVDTFGVLPIDMLIKKYIDKKQIWIDPFARDGKFKMYCKYTNDLNPEFICTHNLDALDFLREMPDESVDGILFDPPYSFHQVVVSYNGYGDKRVHKITPCYDEIKRILKHNGIAIHFGWSSNGCGRGRGFSIEEILLVAHGGSHNDTIVTVEKKIVMQHELLLAVSG